MLKNKKLGRKTVKSVHKAAIRGCNRPCSNMAPKLSGKTSMFGELRDKKDFENPEAAESC